MKLKSDVDLRGVQPEAVMGMNIVESCYQDLGLELMVTSVKDGKHMATSLHYKGLAFDCRTKGLPLILDDFVKKLREKLGPQFDVVLEDVGGENEHAHVEFDVKGK